MIEIDEPWCLYRTLYGGSPEFQRDSLFSIAADYSFENGLDPWDAEELGKEIAEDYMRNHDGWEDTWPVNFEIYGPFCKEEAEDLESLREEPKSSLTRIRVKALPGFDEASFQVEKFDESAYEKKTKRLEALRVSAQENANKYEIKCLVDSDEIEAWSFAQPDTWHLRFHLIVSKLGFVFMGDPKKKYIGERGYGVNWLAGVTPQRNGRGYMEEKIRLGLSDEDHEDDYFCLFLLHFAAKRIMEIKAIEKKGGE